jgi:muramidase (phage lysozyme)
MYKKNINCAFYNKKTQFYFKIFCLLMTNITVTSLKNNKKNILSEKSKYPIIKINEKTIIECKKMDQIMKYLLNPTIRGFLNFISTCEGTARLTKDIDIPTPEILEYKICFTNTICENLLSHPKKINQATGTNGSILKSSASGRYQFISSTWTALENIFQKQKITTKYKKLIIKYINNLNNIYYDAQNNIYKDEKSISINKFGPFFQDLGAIILIDLAGATCDIINKNFKEAIYKLAPIWASLPSYPSGKSYYCGQPAFPLKDALKICESKVYTAEKKLTKLKII